MSSNLRFVILVLVELITYWPTLAGKTRFRIPIVVPNVVSRSNSPSGLGDSNYNPPRSDSDSVSYGFRNSGKSYLSKSHDSTEDIIFWGCLAAAFLLFLIGLTTHYYCLLRKIKNELAHNKIQEITEGPDHEPESPERRQFTSSNKPANHGLSPNKKDSNNAEENEELGAGSQFDDLCFDF